MPPPVQNNTRPSTTQRTPPPPQPTPKPKTAPNPPAQKKQPAQPKDEFVRGAKPAAPAQKTQNAQPPPPPAAKPLRDQLDAKLPKDRFDHGWQRDRVLDRAQQYEQRIADLTKDPKTLDGLRKQFGPNVDKDASIYFHGIGSHFGPEGLQAHVWDKNGQRQVYLQNTAGDWVARADLAAKARRGEIPSADPGRLHGAGGNATFAITKLDADGTQKTWVPNTVDKFDHSPRVRPFQTGDQIQFTQKTGNKEVREEGKAHVPSEQTTFGRIKSTDGRGNWTIEHTNPDGTVKTGKDGKPLTTQLTDADLRKMNNPNVLRNGDRVSSDMRYDTTSRNHQQMVGDFQKTEAYQKLLKDRPGANATPQERAAWEKKMIEAADGFLHEKMPYPKGASKAERDQWQTRITEIDARLKKIDPKSDEAKKLTTEREKLNGQLEPANKLIKERQDLQKEIPTLEKQIAQAKKDGKPADEIAQMQKELDTKRAREKRLVADERYHQELEGKLHNIGDFYCNGNGACRHQAAAMQALMQEVGIDTRLTRGQANTRTGDYRGEHLWLEATLSDGSQLMVDPTWSPNWPIEDLPGLYNRSPARRESPHDTQRDYGNSVVTLPRPVPAAA